MDLFFPRHQMDRNTLSIRTYGSDQEERAIITRLLFMKISHEYIIKRIDIIPKYVPQHRARHMPGSITPEEWK